MKKKMLKKLLALTSVAALAVSSLAGCSGGSTAPAESTEASTALLKQQIQLMRKKHLPQLQVIPLRSVPFHPTQEIWQLTVNP